jgi:hypothetical protein
MDKLRVGVQDVQAMAVRWHAQVAQLGGGAPPTVGLPCQPSAAAVNAGHAAIEVAASSLMGRMRDSAAKVVAADAGYIANETSSAAKLAAVASRVTEL